MNNLVDWFLDRQLKIAVLLGGVCVLIIFLLDFRVAQALLSSFFSLLLIFAGQKLYSVETSENWLRFSYLDTLKAVVGGSLMLLGWLMLLRRVLALAISVLISEISR